MSRKSWHLVLLICLIPALPPLRDVVEASMSLLMLCLLPCLAVAGWAFAELYVIRRRSLMAAMQPYGLALCTLSTFAYGVWMVPIAIDLSRMSMATGIARDVSVCVAGFSMALAIRISPWPVLLFFSGNLVWMDVTVGLIFVDEQVRLCANYLLGDQHQAGAGIVAYSAGAGLWLLGWACRKAGLADLSSDI